MAIFLSACVMTFTCMSLIVLVTYQFFNDKEVDKVRIQTEFAVKAVETMGINYLEQMVSSEYRLTWVSKNGEVLFDSQGDYHDMENHSDRFEIQEALATGYGSDSRYSKTLMLQQIYTAIRLEDGSVLRVSNEERTLYAFIFSLFHHLLLAFGIALFLSAFLAKYLSQQIIKPLHTLDLDHPLENHFAYEEITPLLQRIQRQYQKIDHQLSELSRRQAEFDIITRDMAEGLLLLGQDGEILSINDSASGLFHIEKQECVGKNFLTVNRGKELQKVLKSAFLGKRTEGMLVLSDKQYQVSASPMFEKEMVSGLAVLLVDVTAKSETEQIRREFTANVSHELKTPLHTISGCAELLSYNLVKSEDIPQFSKQIYSEAQRLIRLVEEIISLSKLDEGVELNLKEEVDLLSVAKDVVNHLKEMADKQEVSLIVEGEPSVMLGSYTLLTGIVQNLCENSIKYNEPNGVVTLIVKNTPTAVIFSAKDTGIGISEKEQNLIFQRFYRVDKSRSKEIGGTGLGLAIVKNATSLHNGKISIESTLGEGTCITLEFPHHA